MTALEQNDESLPQLAIPREQLTALLAEARTVLGTQAVHTAAKQEASRRLEAILDQGKKLSTFLRSGVKVHFGNRSEKLAEFRIQPLRSRPRTAPTPPAGEASAPVDSNP